jgi:hypothetical protein
MSSDISFFNSFIAQKTNGIPYSTQWLFAIDNIPQVVGANLSDIDTQHWSIQTVSNTIVKDVINASYTLQGCVFAQEVTTPSENVTIDYVGVSDESRGGFMTAPIVKSRDGMSPLEVSFLETNNSFLDLVVRPWIIKVGFQGLIAMQNESDNIKTTLSLLFFNRGDQSKGVAPAVRKVYKFYNAAPVYCDSDSNDYQKNDVPILKTKWVYTHYTISTSN